jgi:hypothetical protein
MRADDHERRAVGLARELGAHDALHALLVVDAQEV